MDDVIKKWILLALGWLFVYFYPTFQFVMIIGFFIVADTVTGILAAKKQGDAITSKKFRGVISKFGGYGIGILVAHVIEKEFLPDFPSLKLVASLVALSEIISIDENIKVLTGKSLFKAIVKKMQR